MIGNYSFSWKLIFEYRKKWLTNYLETNNEKYKWSDPKKLQKDKK